MDEIYQRLSEIANRYESPLVLGAVSMLGWVVRVIRDHAEGKRLHWSVVLANFISACCFSGLSGAAFFNGLGMGVLPSVVSSFAIGFSTDTILTAISQLGETRLLKGKKR